MISSVDNNTVHMVLNNAKTQESQKIQNTGVINAADTALSSSQTANTDTLELSTQAQSYLDEVSEESEDTSETSEAAETTSTATTDEEVDTDELYTYTDTQLKQLLNLGKITQSEYDEEMASRSSGVSVDG